LSATGFDPNQLRLEITESMAVREDDLSVSALRELRRLGIRLAIDDFGTGNSSLGYLQRFPMDSLKIDRSFVQRLCGDEHDRAMVEAVIAFAHTLGLSATGKGVETSEQLEELSRMGCTQVQGYLFARPVPCAELTAMLARDRAFGNISRLRPAA
jgi:EAL domain-containing protein (putative c-di-GMP-specific phosphodiesterase class I)